MSFLQPLILFALPLIALPILIHLINQNRHKTIPWAATMFLLQAKRMARGMARLRYLLLMLARMLAVAGLIIAASRPMAGGWLGMTASSIPDTTIVVLDRSVSMEEQNLQTSESKRSTALQKLADLIKSTETGTRLVLFDSVSESALEIHEVSELKELPEASATGTSADVPTLMQQVSEYMSNNETGRTDIWLCSDLRRNDWNPTAGRWESVSKELAAREGVRLFLLTYPEVASENLAVSVSGVHRRETAEGAELVMDIQVTRSGDSTEPRPVELTIVIDGARSRLDLELTGNQLVRNGHAIPLDKESRQGWGRVELPRDVNMADNVYNFVYAEPAVRKTIIVSDETRTAEMLRLAAATPADNSLIYEAQILSTASANAIPWEKTAFIVWQAPLPNGLLARQLEDFVASGRSVLFFPPQSPDSTSLFGATWSDWQTPPSGEHFVFKPWRTDSDLLANSLSGAPLPVGQVKCYRACGLEISNATVLWQLEEGLPLLARCNTDQGGVWYCCTLPSPAESNLLSNGVTLYVMVQRALSLGASVMGSARQIECGSMADSLTDSWQPLDETSKSIWVSHRSVLPGLYSSDEKLFALNRSLSEDGATVITEDVLQELLSGVDYTRIDDKVGGAMQLASEVWRTFLVVMICALIAESLLCLPERSSPLPSAHSKTEAVA